MTTRTPGDVLRQISDFFRREGYPELFDGAVSSLTSDDLAELASWPPDSTERVARTYLASLLKDESTTVQVPVGECNPSMEVSPPPARTSAQVLNQLADVFKREGRPELLDGVRSWLTHESLAELATRSVEDVESIALHHLDYELREKGMIPRNESIPAICVDCGRVWTSKGYIENGEVKDSWPHIPFCGWCCFVKHGYAIPRPANPESQPPRELLDPRAASKLN